MSVKRRNIAYTTSLKVFLNIFRREKPWTRSYYVFLGITNYQFKKTNNYCYLSMLQIIVAKKIVTMLLRYNVAILCRRLILRGMKLCLNLCLVLSSRIKYPDPNKVFRLKFIIRISFYCFPSWRSLKMDWW